MKGSLSRKYNAVSLLRSLLLFKMLELLVVIFVLSSLYYVLIDRVMYYRKQYEQAEVSWTLAAINSARRTELAMDEIYLALGRKTTPSALRTKYRNPMQLMNPQPRNYVGEICDPDPRTIEGGSWYFDKCYSWLVYVFSSEKIFSREYPKVLKFNVESLRLLTDPA
jgi:type II secretory pathway pseudopilin PulG